MIGLMNIWVPRFGRAFPIACLPARSKFALSRLSVTSQLNVFKTIRCYKSAQTNFSIPLNISPLDWDEKLKDKTFKLIFGAKKYPQFSLKEKKLVDLYQGAVLNTIGPVVFPNTKEYAEQQEYIDIQNKKSSEYNNTHPTLLK
jgi:hypothetical protein